MFDWYLIIILIVNIIPLLTTWWFSPVFIVWVWIAWKKISAVVISLYVSVVEFLLIFHTKWYFYLRLNILLGVLSDKCSSKVTGCGGCIDHRSISSKSILGLSFSSAVSILWWTLKWWIQGKLPYRSSLLVFPSFGRADVIPPLEVSGKLSSLAFVLSWFDSLVLFDRFPPSRALPSFP